MHCSASLAEIRNDEAVMAAATTFEYSRKDKRDEVIALTEQLLAGMKIRVRKFWGMSLLTLDDVIDDVMNNDRYGDCTKQMLIGNVDPLKDLYRRTANYLISRSLFGEEVTEELGFLP